MSGLSRTSAQRVRKKLRHEQGLDRPLPGQPSKGLPAHLARELTNAPDLRDALDTALRLIRDHHRLGHPFARWKPSGAPDAEDAVPQGLLQSAYLMAIAAFGTDAIALDLVRIDIRRIARWKRLDEDFRTTYTYAIAYFAGRIQHALTRRVFVDEPHWDKMSAVIGFFTLKGLQPHTWGGPTTAPLPGTPQVSVDAGIPNPYLAAAEAALPVPPPPPLGLPAPGETSYREDHDARA